MVTRGESGLLELIKSTQVEALLGANGFGFHAKMIAWITECVTTSSFSPNINGLVHGFFKGRWGLRQGDPLSPYSFTLVMEILTLVLHRKVRMSDSNYAMVIMEGLEEFKMASRLVPSLPKSTAFICNVLNHVKISILGILPFEEGFLPVKYHGVPLVFARLMIQNRKVLVERAKKRLDD
uniref:uncharacterized protein LOC122601267 n=1 Tax=Erigeron canadensis TaxID=72917 RepID=UPI001CB924EF|nr:uncharacterized protein LOC122601267 [Erigeron canadensis]